VSGSNGGTPREQGSRHSSVGASSDLNRARREKLKEVKRKSEERKEQMRDHERRLKAMKQGVKARVQVSRRKGSKTPVGQGPKAPPHLRSTSRYPLFSSFFHLQVVRSGSPANAGRSGSPPAPKPSSKGPAPGRKERPSVKADSSTSVSTTADPAAAAASEAAAKAVSASEALRQRIRDGRREMRKQERQSEVFVVGVAGEWL
jgi:hypothetical protein